MIPPEENNNNHKEQYNKEINKLSSLINQLTLLKEELAKEKEENLYYLQQNSKLNTKIKSIKKKYKEKISEEQYQTEYYQNQYQVATVELFSKMKIKSDQIENLFQHKNTLENHIEAITKHFKHHQVINSYHHQINHNEEDYVLIELQKEHYEQIMSILELNDKTKYAIQNYYQQKQETQEEQEEFYELEPPKTLKKTQSCQEFITAKDKCNEQELHNNQGSPTEEEQALNLINNVISSSESQEKHQENNQEASFNLHENIQDEIKNLNLSFKHEEI